MKVAELCTRNVQLTYRDQPLADAAQRMRDRHVGALLVVEKGDPTRRPIGIITDRDIVRGQLARGADLFCLTVGEVMTPNPLTLSGELTLAEAIGALNHRTVRRAPVLDGSGALLGIVTLDDLLPAVGRQLAALANLMGSQARREGHSASRA